jgi:nucleoside-diphosphate-sugar epimerase
MNVFVAGATGAVGRQLVPLLVSRGHQVIATTRTAGKMARLRETGARAVVMDALDRESVIRAITAARPNVIVHQMTSLASMRSLKHFDREFAMTNRLRTEGTANLLEGAQLAGVERFVAQSYTNWTNAPEGGRIKTEDDPLDPAPPREMRRTLDAIRRLEALVLETSGVTGLVLRYGNFYGPGTSLAPGGTAVEAVRRRQFPIVGRGTGIWSFIHIADAGYATLLALEHAATGVYNIVDDEPAEVSVWLPYLAAAIGAKPPRHVPAWIGRLIIGEPGVSMMTAIRGSSNARAKSVLNWRPLYPTWRDGFRREFAADSYLRREYLISTAFHSGTDPKLR